MNVKDLRERYDQGEIFTYVYFWQAASFPNKITQSCLSQWYACDFIVDDVIYHTSEQYMMAQKALLFDDHDIYEKIMQATRPNKYKSLGRMIRNFDQKLWDENKYDIVLKGNLAKFSQNEELKEYLLNTNDYILVEASPYDKIWGIGLKSQDERISNPHYWEGENLLGFILMDVRDKLSKEG